MTKNSTQPDLTSAATKIRRPKPAEFLVVMERINAIEQAVKIETARYELEIKTLELEKQYLWNIMGKTV